MVLVGAAPWVMALADELTRHGVPTLLVARGRSDLAARDDLRYRLHTGLVHELNGADLLTDMSGAIIASEDDETNLVALGVILEHLPRGRVWLLPGDHRRAEPPGVVAEVEQWTRAPFAPGTSHTTLDDAVAAGYQVRTVPIESTSPDAITLVRLRSDGAWTAATDDRRAGDRVVVLDAAHG